MEAICYYAYEASSDLASERGTYSTYQGSKWDRGILPQDSIAHLEEERGEAIDVPKEGKMDWAPVREKIANGPCGLHVITAPLGQPFSGRVKNDVT